MALDQFMEKINLWAKVLVNGELTGERISAVVPSLNYVLSMEEAYPHIDQLQGERRQLRRIMRWESTMDRMLIAFAGQLWDNSYKVITNLPSLPT